MQKRCNTCEQLKDTEAFAKAPSNKDGHNNTCKECVVKRNRQYWRTPYGRISQIYAVQCVNSRERGHPPPTYTREELFEWAIGHGLENLIMQWSVGGFTKNLAPSIDRLDDSKGYALDNIQLVTWNQNNQKMYDNRKSCSRITAQNKRIQQKDLEGNHIAYYDSISHAARETGITRTNINGMCKGKPYVKSVGGYIWAYAD